MNFSTVPPGTPAPAALILRGGDHDIEYLGGTAYANALGATHLQRIAAGANTFGTPYSSCAGAAVEFMLTNDAGVLASFHTQIHVLPAKLQAAYAYLLSQPQLQAAPLSEAEFRAGGEAILASLDLSAPPAALCLTAGDIGINEPPAGGAGPWRRAGLVQHLAEPVTSGGGYYRLRAWGAIIRTAPGIFLAASRDNLGCAYYTLIC